MTIKNVKEERKDASAKSSHHLVAFKVIKKGKKKEFTASPFTWKTMSEFRSIVQLKFGE